MKRRSGALILGRGGRPRTKVGLDWCGEPAEELDPDIATNPSLSPPTVGEHARQTVESFDVPGVGSPQEATMETIYRCCAGLDVHKMTVVACVRQVEPSGRVR